MLKTANRGITKLGLSLAEITNVGQEHNEMFITASLAAGDQTLVQMQ